MNHFKEVELECPCCGKYIPDEQLLIILNSIREYYDKPVYIHSSTRCKKHNKEVGGTPHSKHLLGWAADIVVKDIPPDEVYIYLDKTYSDTFGIGRYDNFTHIDIRPRKARWDFRKNKG